MIIGTNIGVKSPLFFTTNRNMTIDGVSFSVYDIDLRKYTKSALLDGYNIRQFRIRHWPADADFETGPSPKLAPSGTSRDGRAISVVQVSARHNGPVAVCAQCAADGG